MNRDEIIEAIRTRLETTTYDGPDSYYAGKDMLRRLEAKKRGRTECQHDPAGFWFGGMSN